MKRLALGLCAIVLVSCATASPHEDMIQELASDPSPPDRAAGIAMIESVIRATVKDPGSAQFEWPNGFVNGWYRAPFGKRYEGWITCGTVNAKNSYGGYVGRAAAIGVIRGGAVITTGFDDAAARYGTFVAEACRKIGVPAG